MKIDAINRKIKRLKRILKGMKSVCLAYSGGVDSTFLLKIAMDSLGADHVLAVTAKSVTYPKREYESAVKIARGYKAKLMAITTHEIHNKSFRSNPVNRCYYCKKELFSRLVNIASQKGIAYVMDGANYDDRKVYIYGMRAARELGVRSPLKEAKITKKEIRAISRSLDIPTWDKPSFACLASRLPYNTEITSKAVRRIGRAEEFIFHLGFKQVRVRSYGDLARIELLPKEIERLAADKKNMNSIVKKMKGLGFLYITLDLEGYQSGSMNKPIKTEKSYAKEASGITG